METALHDLCSNKLLRAAFRDDPEAALAARPLTDEERRIVIDFDIAALLARGVNPMILQGFWVATRGPAAFPEFVARVNALGEWRHG